MANGIRKMLDAVADKVCKLSGGSLAYFPAGAQSATRFKGELGVKLIKAKKRWTKI